MAYIKFTSTRKLGSAINYNTTGKPHYDDKYINGNRALAIGAINGSVDPKEFVKQQNIQFKSQNLPKKSVHGEREIIAFAKSELNYKKLADRKKAMKIVADYDKLAYPNNACHFTLQADGKNHILHIHNLINPRRLDTGKSITNITTTRTQLPLLYQAMGKNGVAPTNKLQMTKINGQKRAIIAPKRDTSIAIHGIEGRGKQSWVNYIENHANTALKSAQSGKSFNQSLNKAHISILKPLRTRQHGKLLHFYKSARKGQHNIKLTSSKIQKYQHLLPKSMANSLIYHKGEYLRTRKGANILFSYHHHLISGSKLGRKFKLYNIKKRTNYNAHFTLKNHINHRHTKRYKVDNHSNKKVKPQKTVNNLVMSIRKSVGKHIEHHNYHILHNGNHINVHQKERTQNNAIYDELVQNYKNQGFSEKIAEIKATNYMHNNGIQR